MDQETQIVPEHQQDPFADIERLRQAAMAAGANDWENGAFFELQEGLRSGDLPHDIAVKRAEEILRSKQDYH